MLLARLLPTQQVVTMGSQILSLTHLHASLSSMQETCLCSMCQPLLQM